MARKTERPKGYMDWTPTAPVAEVVAQVQGVLREYANFGPMTVRQIFYRLVGQYDYPKDERAYNRLAEYLVKARRSQKIAFDSIRDDGTTTYAAASEYTRRDVWRHLLSVVGAPQDFLRLDKNEGQPHHIELWCEAAGMAPMLAQMVRERDVSVYSTGGFSSLTVTHEIAQRVIRRSKPTYFLHVGDYDPSGESIFTSMSQDVGAFVIGEYGGRWNANTGETLELKGGRECLFLPRRVALTADQVEEFDLPTAPAKVSDSRSVNWYDSTTQAEAMPPTLLQQVVLEALAELTDDEALAAVEDREAEERERLRAAVEDQSVDEVLERAGLAEDPDVSLVELMRAVRDVDLQD